VKEHLLMKLRTIEHPQLAGAEKKLAAEARQ